MGCAEVLSRVQGVLIDGRSLAVQVVCIGSTQRRWTGCCVSEEFFLRSFPYFISP